MPAIKPHETKTDTESAWDAGEALTRAPNDAGVLHYMHAWQDPDGDPSAKSSYKFPHHLPGVDTPAVISAVNNALARLSQADIPEEDREGVERHLRKHRKDAGLEQPEERAAAPLGGAAEMIRAALAGAAENVKRAFGGIVSALGNLRAVAMPNIYQMVAAKLEQMSQESGVWNALVDVYLDGGNMFAVVAADGKLYKASVTLAGGDVILGEFDRVEQEYRPVGAEGERRLRVLRQADGRYRWFAFPACTAVLNRSGEIDSRKLFSNFVEKIRSGKTPYPYLTFWHVGESLVLGKADYAAVDGYAYLLSGTFSDDPLARAIARRLEQGAEGWGTSIGYLYEPDRVERHQIGGGITVPAYEDGVNVEVSILREKDAASLFTGIYITKGENKSMNKKVIDELRALVGDDPEAEQVVDQLAAKIDNTNREIEARNLIRRAEAGAEPASQEEPASPEPSAVERLAEEVRALTEQVSALAEQVSAQAEQIRQVEERQGATLDELFADLGRNLMKPRAAYRPTAPSDSVTLGDIAASTLGNL